MPRAGKGWSLFSETHVARCNPNSGTSSRKPTSLPDGKPHDTRMETGLAHLMSQRRKLGSWMGCDLPGVYRRDVTQAPGWAPSCRSLGGGSWGLFSFHLWAPQWTPSRAEAPSSSSPPFPPPQAHAPSPHSRSGIAPAQHPALCQLRNEGAPAQGLSSPPPPTDGI